jgi:hypothetical protein
MKSMISIFECRKIKVSKKWEKMRKIKNNWKNGKKMGKMGKNKKKMGIKWEKWDMKKKNGKTVKK